jgi:hypothetical protein
MKIYTSNRLNSYLTVLVLIFLALVWQYFHSFYILLLLFPFTLFPLFLIIATPVFDVNFFIQDGYLCKVKKRNLRGIDNSFKIKLSEINKIERHKRIVLRDYISLFYSGDKRIDIYLESYEIDSFIADISRK